MEPIKKFSQWELYMRFLFYYVEQLKDFLPQKTAFSAVAAGVACWFDFGNFSPVNSFSIEFGVEVAILRLIIYLAVIDFILGTFAAIKFNKFTIWGLMRGILGKIAAYALFIITFGSVGKCAGYAFGSNVPAPFLVYFIIFILVLTDTRSILQKMELLGFKIPKPLMAILSMIEVKAEKTINEKLGNNKPDNDNHEKKE